MPSLTSRKAVAAGEFIGRDIAKIVVDRGSGTLSDAELLDAVQDIQTRATVLETGASGAQTVKMIIAGMDFDGANAYGSSNTYLDELSTLTGYTVTAG